MKTILVPFDFSAYSLEALKTAQKIQEKIDAKVICVTVIPSEIDFEKLSEEAKANYPDLLNEKAEAENLLPEYIQKIAPSKRPIEAVVKIGVPPEQILRIVSLQQDAIIVMGAHGKGYTEGKFIGSNLQKLLRKAACPVIAVKQALEGNDFRKVVFASTFGSKAANSFSEISFLVHAFKSSVTLLYVNTPAKFSTTKEVEAGMDLVEKANTGVVFHRSIYNARNPEMGIVEFCNDHNMGLVSMLTGDHASSPDYQIGATETVLFHSKTGVLSIKER